MNGKQAIERGRPFAYSLIQVYHIFSLLSPEIIPKKIRTLRGRREGNDYLIISNLSSNLKSCPKTETHPLAKGEGALPLDEALFLVYLLKSSPKIIFQNLWRVARIGNGRTTHYAPRTWDDYFLGTANMDFYSLAVKRRFSQ